jgi:hypothetical protein
MKTLFLYGEGGGIARALYIGWATGPNFAFQDNGLSFVNQIELGKTKGIGLAG